MTGAQRRGRDRHRLAGMIDDEGVTFVDRRGRTDEVVGTIGGHPTGRPRSASGRPRAIRQAAQLDAVAHRLAGEFAPVLPVDVVPRVVNRACQDLFHEVPAESLPEFVFRAARRRLLEAVGPDLPGTRRRGPGRRRAS